MLTELASETPRPTRLSGAGELLQGKLPMAPVEVKETPEGLRLEAETWRLEMNKKPWQLLLTSKRTNVAWRLATSGPSGGGISWVAKDGATSLRLTQVEQIEGRNGQWTVRGKVEGSQTPSLLNISVLAPGIIHLFIGAPESGEKAGLKLGFSGPGPFFGLGERFSKARLDGQKITLHPEDKGFEGTEHNWTYIPAPFLFTPLGLGIYLDTGTESVFDLTQAARQQFTIQLKRPAVNCYFFVGDPKGIIRDYTGLTGRTPVPPPWAFGVWLTSLQGGGPVLSNALRLRELGIPTSALWVWDVMDDESNLGWGLWTVGYYGGPGEFNARLHQLGFKVLGYVHPYLRTLLLPFNLPSPAYQEGLRNHYFVLKPDGQPVGPSIEPVPTANIDFTNPAAVDWWEKMLQRIVGVFGFDGWMEDFGEWIEADHRFAAGKTGQEMANLYPLFYHKISYEIARKLKPDVVQFSRSGYSGSQAFSRVIWGGDQQPDWSRGHGLPSLVPAGITAGLAGFAVWGPDILSCGTSKELWIRWCEFGALTPIMRDHLWDKPKFAVDLWFDAETIETFRRYARLHVSLFPYFYTYAYEAAALGLPIMRHPLVDSPEDVNTYGAEDEYLLGEKILVAPVIEEGARTRFLYLPPGSWVDYWTGQLLEGGRQVEVPAPLEHIPILVRAGSVIPLVSPQIETLAQDLAGNKYRTLDHSLTWQVFPAAGTAHGSFVLYDGTAVAADQDPAQIQVNGEHSPVVRPFEVVLPLTREPRRVVLAGEPLEKLDDAGYRAGKQGWRLRPDDGTLHVLFVRDNFKLQVAIR